MPKDSTENTEPGPTGPRSGTDRPTRRLLNERSLRGLAHPLRIQLLNALRRYGPATASQLGKRLGESSGATSYHLRQLAEFGFVEDAPEHGKGRERWWRAVEGGIAYDGRLVNQDDPEIRGAADVLMHEVAAAHYQELTGWIADRAQWTEEWAEVGDMSDMTLRLTAGRLAELTRKLHELVDSFETPALAAEEGAEEVRVHLHALPFRTSRD
ncbi:winged helix-turn-helix domain-containing protein [Streptomyces sp. NPDC049954]|uniref:ArsR/SmtB family transcription factor n=1 Tax=Streptomyces sp. NPDC049954 TaxID=3155779 RepID=UPI003426C3CC